MGSIIFCCEQKATPMKIIFVIKSLNLTAGGAERVFCSVCSGLVARGHQVTIITFDASARNPFYYLDPRVSRLTLIAGSAINSGTITQVFDCMRKLRKVVSFEKPDVVVGFMHSSYVILAFALLGMKIPLIGSEHTVREYYRKHSFQYFLVIIGVILLNKLTVISEKIRDSHPFFLKSKMALVPNPIEQAINLSTIGEEKGAYTLLSVGRLEESKSHSTLIKAFSKVADVFPKWHLRIVGDGPMFQDLQKLIKELELDSRISMPGFVKDIGFEYESAELFVMPSRFEAFGLVTAEAMSHGIPVIGFSDCPGTNDLIDSFETGVLLDPEVDRVAALASGLVKLMASPLLRRRLGIAGCKKIQELPSHDDVCVVWETLISSLVRPS
jgi:glycosyltransferase involved in cell wall biosynthesis